MGLDERAQVEIKGRVRYGTVVHLSVQSEGCARILDEVASRFVGLPRDRRVRDRVPRDCDAIARRGQVGRRLVLRCDLNNVEQVFCKDAVVLVHDIAIQVAEEPLVREHGGTVELNIEQSWSSEFATIEDGEGGVAFACSAFLYCVLLYLEI